MRDVRPVGLDHELRLEADQVVGPEQVLVAGLLEAVAVEHVEEEDPDEMLGAGGGEAGAQRVEQELDQPGEKGFGEFSVVESP